MSFWKFVEKPINSGGQGNASTDTELELWIQGDIVDNDDAWIYEWLDYEYTTPNPFKQELKNHSGKDITVWIDSFGGSVFAATSIYNALKGHKGKKTVKIDAKAMSAASVIAMAGDEILMSPTGLMMIHDPLVGMCGNLNAERMRFLAGYLDEVKEAIINAYQIRTQRSRSKISQMMSDETYMSARTAVNEGFADNILQGENIIEINNASAMMISRGSVINHSEADIQKMIALYDEKNPAPPQGNKPDEALYIANQKIKVRENLIKSFNFRR